MSIRWNIRDRATGHEMIIGQPQTEQQADALRSIIKNCSSVGISPLGKFNQHKGR